jgi:hypothetical protein
MDHIGIEATPESTNGRPSRPRVGFGIIAIDEPMERGVQVLEFLPGSSAIVEPGLCKDDVIISIKVRDEADLHNILNGGTERELVLHVLRDQQELWVKVRAEEWSEEREERAYQILMEHQAKRNRGRWWTHWYDLWGLLR